MRHSSIIRQRPDWFTLDKNHSLAKGLVFAGLGRVRGSTRYHDSSPYGNHGTLTGFVTPAASWSRTLGRAVLGFDGSDDYIELPASPVLRTNYPSFSICFWSRFPTSNSNVWIAWSATGDSYRCVFFNNVATTTWRTRQVGATGTNDLTVSVASGNRHVALIFNGAAATKTIYVDGVPGTPATSVAGPVGFSDAATSRIGNSGIAYLNSTISDATFHNRALSPAEIAQLADPSNVMLSGLILPPRRRVFASAGAAPATNRRRRFITTCVG